MVTATISSKYQITLPADMVRALSLKAGDKLMEDLIDDHILLLPKPDSWTEYFNGSMKGFSGTGEEIDRYIAEERRSPERDKWAQQFDDLVATDEVVGAVVGGLKSFYPRWTANPNDLHDRLRETGHKVRFDKMQEELKKLVTHGSVRRIPLDGEKIGSETEVFRLAWDFAEW